MTLNKLKNIPGSNAWNGVCWIAFAIALAPLAVYYAFSSCYFNTLSISTFRYILVKGLFVPAAILLYGICRFAGTL